MKSIKTASFSILFLALAYSASAQSLMQKIKNTTLVFGLSEHIVIDNGKEYQFKFDTKNWNLMPFPSKISAEAYLKKGWSLGTEFSYTSYKANKIVDNILQTKDNTFFSADFLMRYHLETLLLKQVFLTRI